MPSATDFVETGGGGGRRGDWPTVLRRVRLFGVAAALAVGPLVAHAQRITPRTVPVRQAQQFDVYPSDRAGMAGVSIALDDSLRDPFVNPAKSVRAPDGLVSMSPFVHSVSLSGGGGRSIPVSAFGSSGGWSGAALVALQELDRPERSFGEPLNERHGTNEYVAGSVARRIAGGLAIGASASWANLSAVDGVDRMYVNYDSLHESGHETDFRLGALKEWSRGRTLEVMLLAGEYRMTHDLHYPDIYTYSPCCPGNPPDLTPARSEQNVDRTRVWGAHTGYSQPVGTGGWRVGWLATFNRLTHPEIPAYRFGGVPFDPGFTNAFNAGAGIARLWQRSAFGVDVILEPMWSHTWANAARDTMTAVDGVVHAGERMVDNHFRFSNARMRFGFAQDFDVSRARSTSARVQAGLGVYAISYRLAQSDHVSFVSRRQDESWIEWSPSLGAELRGRTVSVGYTFMLTCGPDCGRQDAQPYYPPPVPVESDGGGVIAAPNGPLAFQGGRATTHRLTVTIRMR